MGCHHNSSDMELYFLLESHCGSAEVCEVDLAQFTPWEWDQLVVVGMHALPSQAAAAVGSGDHSVPEFEEQLIFLRQGEVVKVVKRTYDPEKPYHRTVFFESLTKGEKVLSLSPAEALLKVRKEKGPGYKNYYFSR